MVGFGVVILGKMCCGCSCGVHFSKIVVAVGVVITSPQ